MLLFKASFFLNIWFYYEVDCSIIISDQKKNPKWIVSSYFHSSFLLFLAPAGGFKLCRADFLTRKIISPYQTHAEFKTISKMPALTNQKS